MRPREMAVVLIGRCPKCREFPAEWSAMEFDCSECGVTLIGNINYRKRDGAEHWRFQRAFVSERRYPSRRDPK